MFGAEGALQLRPGKSLYSRACALLRKYLFRGLLPCRLSAMFSPAPHHITPRSLTANHRPRFPPTSGGGAARPDPSGAATPQSQALPRPGPALPPSAPLALAPAPCGRAGWLQWVWPREPAYASTDVSAFQWEAGKGGPERRWPNGKRDST